MALLSKETGRYLKVIREATSFTPNSVHVSYYEFNSKEDRDEYFKRKDEIERFLVAGNFKCNQLQVDAMTLREKTASESEEAVETELTEVKNLLSKADKLQNDLLKVRFGWDKPDPLPKKFDSEELFAELGFKKEWCKPLNNWGMGTLMTGAFTNQTFSYDCLYKELKKVFVDDFIDC